jgi:hypothetical protein
MLACWVGGVNNMEPRTNKTQQVLLQLFKKFAFQTSHHLFLLPYFLPVECALPSPVGCYLSAELCSIFQLTPNVIC